MTDQLRQAAQQAAAAFESALAELDSSLGDMVQESNCEGGTQFDTGRGYEALWAAQAELENLRAALATQGEPVARVELITAGGNAGIATRIVEIDDPLRERLRPGDVLYTRPAPAASAEREARVIEQNARKAAQEQLYAERERHTAEVKRLQAEIGRLQAPAASVQANGGDRVFLVATGEVYEGQETYTRHDIRPPMCDAEVLYTHPAPAASVSDEREAFEEWVTSQGYNTERDMFKRGMYQSTLTWELWRVWQARAALRPAQAGAPDIDYEALINAAFATNTKWAQGTAGCVAFARGAEWFRSTMLAAAPTKDHP